MTTDVTEIDQLEIEAFGFSEPDPDDGNDHLAHIINPPGNPHIWQAGMTARDIAEVARVTGAFIFALCGHKFIPKLNPEKYPVCQACMDIASSIISQDG